jgi:hypothetical protein
MRKLSYKLLCYLLSIIFLKVLDSHPPFILSWRSKKKFRDELEIYLQLLLSFEKI